MPDTRIGMGFRSNQTDPADTGLDFGENLYNRQLGARQRYAEPFVPEQEATFTDAGNTPYWYNTRPMQPRKYQVPTAAKERHMARQAIRVEAGKHQVVRPDPITDEEVEMLQSMQDQQETARFDQWFTAKYDPLRPGGFAECMKMYPEYVRARVQQAQTDYEVTMRKELIDTWGPQSPDDLYLMYMFDQGVIKAPKLVRPHETGSGNYTHSVLSPYKYLHDKQGPLKLPGYGSSVLNSGSTESIGAFKNKSALDGDGGGMQGLAAEMYQPTSDQGKSRNNVVTARPDALYGST